MDRSAVRDLPAVIVGCGPSAVPVPHRPGSYLLCTVNDAVRLCERVDIAAINDTPALARISDQASKIEALLLPRYLHDDPGPSSLTMFSHARWDYGFESVPTRLFSLHTDPVTLRGTFGRCRSTSDSLIAWLLSEGYRRLYTIGIEWDGRGGWAQGLPCGHEKSVSHRQSIWQHTLKRITDAGATVVQGLP